MPLMSKSHRFNWPIQSDIVPQNRWVFDLVEKSSIKETKSRRIDQLYASLFDINVLATKHFTFPIGKVLSRSKKLISRFWRIFTFWGPRSPKKWIIKNVRLSVCLSICLSVCLSVLCGGHRGDTIVTINLKFGMWAQNVNISSRFFDIFFILIIKGSLP